MRIFALTRQIFQRASGKWEMRKKKVHRQSFGGYLTYARLWRNLRDLCVKEVKITPVKSMPSSSSSASLTVSIDVMAIHSLHNPLRLVYKIRISYLPFKYKSVKRIEWSLQDFFHPPSLRRLAR